MDGIVTTIQIKKNTPDHLYTAFCNKVEEQGIFKACGNCDDKWIMVEFEDELDQLGWMIAMGIMTAKKVKNKCWKPFSDGEKNEKTDHV